MGSREERYYFKKDCYVKGKENVGIEIREEKGRT